VELAQAQSAYWEVHRLWDSLARGSKARVVVHTPVGRAANELTRIAREVGADVIVLEAHARGASRRIFHRSLLARVTRTAPCSVLALRGPTLRKRRPGLLAHPEPITRGLT
ncbi:MAG TPA: universal stress protein, partial [Polyangiaceae bacterium]